ncbi:DUF262 domain-containing protein [Dichotomicrobium thermohalophilum]|uniref:Uncharacterized protein DUF1524 n=1 Tax=Dichotomicrobium thermohalophilum TaxID=933063 RepID=A0A397Q6V5_9HYPH|nr:DUF262 domain-containing protein [Dichotomicrobium thermohalophilum]RIA56788.1 uncharacterized protein DUF1524 [Dichotomicrobium thermohalophilum]
MAPVSSEVTSLGRFLRGERAFVVPRFQRHYSWDEDHVEIFWRDIFNIFAEDDGDYFLGAIVVRHCDPEGPIVIDGQQRLITVSILLAALRSILAEGDQSEGVEKLVRAFLLADDAAADAVAPRIMLNRADRSFYDRYIVGESRVDELMRMRRDDSLPLSNRLLADCFCFMHRQLQSFTARDWTPQDLARAVLKAIDEKIYIIRLDVRSDYDAFVLFETLNDRGLSLSESDLLKNHLLAAAGPHLKDTQADWETIEGNLGGERLLKFVRHHWLSSRGMTSRAGLYPDIKRAVSTPQTVAAYTEELCSASEYYDSLRDPNSRIWAAYGPERQPWLRERIDCLRLLRSDQIFVVLLAALETDREGFPDLLDMLISFTFRYTTICNLSPSALLPVLIAAAQHIRESGRVDAEEIFRQFLSPLYPDDSQFHSAFSRRAIRYNGLARYVLNKLNDQISGVDGAAQGHPITDLEHILPKRFQRNWTVERKDFPGGPEKYVHRLGNMTLLTTNLNRELGNQPYEVKRDAFAQEALEITRMIADEPRWTADAIGRRQNWMAGLAIKIWRCP